jgi:carbon monoxide dehydrogenase subunit G
MGIDITAEVHVACPRADVGAYMTNPANDPEWIGGLREVRRLDDGPLEVGSRVAREASFLGRKIEYVNEILELDPERVLDMQSVVAPFPMRITYTFEDANGGTVVRNRARGGGMRILAPLVKRNVQRDLNKLRDRLERS